MLRILAIALLVTATLAAMCTPCNPKGSTGQNPPGIGPDLDSLYIDLLGSVRNIHFQRRWADPIESRTVFCCRETLDCVNVINLNVPMCYDKFTTNYAFADGSYGSIKTGEYNTNDGSQANLITGNYTKAGGEQGNIYASDPGAKPNTATLSIPPQWTGTGIGSAIPPTQLVSLVTMTTTGPTTTPTATNATGTQHVAPTATSKKGGAANVKFDSTRPFVVSVITVLVYFLGAL